MRWFVCSACGGTGKTTIAAALALAAARAGLRTALVDASGPSHAADVLLSVQDTAVLNLADALTGEAQPEAALYPSPLAPGLFYAAASYDRRLSFGEIARPASRVAERCDLVVADTWPGDDSLIPLLEAEDRVILTAKPAWPGLRASAETVRRLRETQAELTLALCGLPGTDQRRQPRFLEAMGQEPDLLIPWEPAMEESGASAEAVLRLPPGAALQEAAARWLRL